MGNTSTAKENQRKRIGLLIGILLIASNLRVPLTAVGPLLPSIRDDLAISSTSGGSLTTLPLLAFAILSPFVPAIARRFGTEQTIFYAFIVLTIGLIVRSLDGVTSVFAGTIILGLAITFGNVLLPSLVKMKFPLKIGLLTGLYAVFMNIFGALASGMSLPLSRISGWGWRGSLAFWSFLSIVAIICWIPQLKKNAHSSRRTTATQNSQQNIWRSPLAWNITVYMGTQSLVFYTFITWLPDILSSYGYSSDTAGWLLSLMQFAFIPFTFIVPIIAEKMTDQKLLSALTGILVILATGGLVSGHSVLITIAVICIGAACGSAFSLSMMFFSLRANDAHEASRVSGMAQSVGYLIAAAGPVLLGALYDSTADWILPLFTISIIGVILTVTGFVSGKDQKISVF